MQHRYESNVWKSVSFGIVLSYEILFQLRRGRGLAPTS
jgi:hypothetical protein